MEPLQDWRSSQFENELGRLDRGGVGFEFLRRNRQYRQDYATALTEIAVGGTTRTEAISRLSRRWGLAFPGRPICIGIDRSSCLAGAILPGHSYCRCCPKRLRGVFAA